MLSFKTFPLGSKFFKATARGNRGYEFLKIFPPKIWRKLAFFAQITANFFAKKHQNIVFLRKPLIVCKNCDYNINSWAN
jgi:hypothetical protein